MNKLTNSLAAFATLALAALPLAGVAGAVHAAEGVHVQTADLNLNTPEGVAKYNQRVNQAAAEACKVTGQTNPVAACQKTIQEAFAKRLATAQQQQMATNRPASALTSN